MRINLLGAPEGTGALDITWLKDEGNGTNAADQESEDLLSEIFTQLQTAMDALNELAGVLGNGRDEK
jgi:hypothetical protein